MSPAEKFFKRAFRSHLPTLERFFNPVQKGSETKVQFQVGDTVRIQNAVSRLWDDSGVIREVRESGRSYFIDRGSGKDIILRNNIYLKLMPERETKRSEFLDGQQKSDSGSEQQYPDTLKLRRSKRIEQAGSLQAGSDYIRRSKRIAAAAENNSLRNVQQISISNQQQQIAGSGSRDTFKFRASDCQQCRIDIQNK
jgi:hypothetical protein